MTTSVKLKKRFLDEREKLFNNKKLIKSAYRFCFEHSTLVERYIFEALKNVNADFAVASSGGFCRRELSPYSDIDLMIILPEVDGSEEEISECVTLLWDSGIEVSHTVRHFSDIEKFYELDLHAFTQFFETRFLWGSKKVYDNWNKKLFSFLDEDKKIKVVNRFFDDIQLRYKKYGDSPKVLEPNIKFTAGGLRDLQLVQWICSIQRNVSFNVQEEITHTEAFIQTFREQKVVSGNELKRLLKSYELLLAIRNQLHLMNRSRNDRFEFAFQEKLSEVFGYGAKNWHEFMRDYFLSTSIINRFSKTMLKRFREMITNPLPEQLTIRLDEDFSLKGNVIATSKEKSLTLSAILRAFYYRGLYDARFDENLRSLVIESADEHKDDAYYEYKSSVFLREIFRLDKNVAKTLTAMNEMGLLAAFMPEFRELVGFFQPGVYHCYTADEHTIIAIRNLELLSESEDSKMAFIYSELLEKEILYLAVFFHDIAKPISVSGHEIIGAEIASSVMSRLGYENREINLVQFLVKHHLTMEQVAFRRNLNDAETLNNFVSIFPSVKALDLLYLLTYADLSAVNTVVWTQWKSDQLYELYRKARAMLVDELSGEELLYEKTVRVLKRSANNNYKEHLEEIDDVGYIDQFSEDEISSHVSEIEKGSHLAVFFKEDAGFTNISVISRDSFSILSKLCGALSINDLNIHDARIFTRKDGIIIDSFNVTDYRTHKTVEKDRYTKIQNDLKLCVEGDMQIGQEFNRLQNKWWRIENKLFKKKDKIKIRFEEHEKYTIIDVAAPDKLGLLYTITRKMNELGLNIYFAKISTKADDVIDSFYTLDRNNRKVPIYDYEMIKLQLTESIKELL